MYIYISFNIILSKKLFKKKKIIKFFERDINESLNLSLFILEKKKAGKEIFFFFIFFLKEFFFYESY